MRSKFGKALPVLIFFVLLTSMQALGEQEKIGYIDMQKALQESSDGTKVKAAIDKEFNDKRVALQKREAELKKLESELRQKASALSDEARNKQMQELQTEAMKFQREVSESQARLQKMQLELTQPIIERLEHALGTVAKLGGYAMVLEKGEQSVLFAKNDLDLTDAVVKEFEKSPKSKNK